MSELKPKHRGAATELRAVLWLLDKGYEVFRNVSQHGAIDLIAVRNSETLLLDVRTAVTNQPQWQPKASPEQTELGVKFLISTDGNFAIVEPRPPEPPKVCARHGCGKTITNPRRVTQRFCSSRCHDIEYRQRNAAKYAEGTRAWRARQKAAQPHLEPC